MWQSVVVSCALLVAVSGFITGPITGPGISQCTYDWAPLPLASGVAGCSATPCALTQLEDFDIEVIFRAPRKISTMTTTATAFILVGTIQLPIPFNLGEQSVTCNYLLNSSCPVNEGDLLLYKLSLFVDSAFPVGMTTTVEFVLRDENHQPFTCIRVPIIIQPPRTQSAQLAN